MTDTCPVCGDQAAEDRFSVTFEDYAESTAHVSQHNLCGECWDRLLTEVVGR